MGPKASRVWMVFALSIVCAVSASAADLVIGTGQELPTLVEPEQAPPESWGASAVTQLVIPASSVEPPNDTITYNTLASGSTGIGLFQTSAGSIDWWVGVNVPSGAIITTVTIEACDTTATGNLAFGLARGVAPGGAAANVTPIGTTGAAPTPGCAFFSVSPTATLQVANGTNDYWVFFQWQGAGSFGPAVQLHTIRISYRLQVSAAPGVATFPNDVPTSHPFFRFVEAMAASGITGGCATGSFCPDNPVTRGQMAVFLATALGLHFAP